MAGYGNLVDESNGSSEGNTAHRLECPLLANNGLSGHGASTSAPPPRADIRWPMSDFALFTSASRPTPDVAGVGHESPQLTQLGHSSVPSTNGRVRPGTDVRIGLGEGPLADHKPVVGPMLFIWPVLTQAM